MDNMYIAHFENKTSFKLRATCSFTIKTENVEAAKSIYPQDYLGGLLT